MLKERLKTEYHEALKTDHALIGKLAGNKREGLNVHPDTIRRWNKNNDPQLTQPEAQKIIREHFGLPKSAKVTEVYETELSTSTVL